MKGIFCKVYCQVDSDIRNSQEGYMTQFLGETLDDLYKWVSSVCVGCTNIIRQKDKIIAMFDDSTLVTNIQRCEEYYIKDINRQFVGI